MNDRPAVSQPTTAPQIDKRMDEPPRFSMPQWENSCGVRNGLGVPYKNGSRRTSVLFTFWNLSHRYALRTALLLSSPAGFTIRLIIEAVEKADIKSNSHSIREGLVAFRRQFESSPARLGSALENALPSESGSDLALHLIGALQTIPAARVPPSPIDRNARIRTHLFSLGSKVGSSDFDIKSTIPLIGPVINNAPDVEVWSAVFNLVSRTNPKPTTFFDCLRESRLRYAAMVELGISKRD